MRTYPVKTPRIIQQIFTGFTWSIQTEQKVLFLTFDDGPVPEITPWVLQTLSNYNAKATFFCIGKNIEKFPKIFKSIIEQEHSIGNHTYNHLNGWQSNSKEYLRNIDKTEKSIGHGYSISTSSNESNKVAKFFRPPYGKVKPNQTKKILEKGYQIIMWDVLSGDFDRNLSKEVCFQNTVKNTKKGSIIVFHDSEKAFKNLAYSLPKVLEYFTKRGYEFKAL